MAKHHREPPRKYIKKVAMAGGAVATATAMTVGIGGPVG
jgi:hypothetical protein